jgi:hypothetical protein
MNTFVSLEIVISVETLGTLIALERTVGRWSGHPMRWWMTAI